MIAQRDKDQRELEELKLALQNLKEVKGLDQYKNKFDENRHFMQGKLSEVSQFKLGTTLFNFRGIPAQS